MVLGAHMELWMAVNYFEKNPPLEKTGTCLFLAAIAFITYCLEVFLQTFEETLTCFSKHKKH